MQIDTTFVSTVIKDASYIRQMIDNNLMFIYYGPIGFLSPELRMKICEGKVTKTRARTKTGNDNDGYRRLSIPFYFYDFHIYFIYFYFINPHIRNN